VARGTKNTETAGNFKLLNFMEHTLAMVAVDQDTPDEVEIITLFI
jgi:hypothetical protein